MYSGSMSDPNIEYCYLFYSLACRIALVLLGKQLRCYQPSISYPRLQKSTQGERNNLLTFVVYDTMGITGIATSKLLNEALCNSVRHTLGTDSAGIAASFEYFQALCAYEITE